MPTETINYKVKIDASSVADQLQQIRNQVDMAMATYTFNSTRPDPTPQAYSFPVQGFGSQISAIGSAAGSSAQGAALAFMDSARLGFQKFSHDIQNTMLMTPVRGPSLTGTQGIGGTDFFSMGGIRLGFESLTGFGHDPSMSMTPGRYQRYAREAFSDRALEIGMGLVDFGTGASIAGGLGAGALGYTGAATAFGVGAAVLAPISIGAGVFMATGGYDINASMRGRAFSRDASWRFLSGRFSNEEASQIGMGIASAGRSAETVGYGISQNDAMSMVQQFTEIGGFDTTRTAEEFRQRVKTLVDNTRKYVQILGVTQQEAIGMMKEFMDLGIVSNAGGGANLGIGMAAQAYRAGYTPSEFHRFGIQSAEMVRGTGIMMGSAYMSGQGALAGIRGMMQAGALPFEIVNQLGGAEQAAATINRVGYNFGMSEAGLTYFAARDYLGGAPGALNPTQAIAAATGRIQTVSDYLNFRGAQPRLAGQMGAEALFAGQANWYLSQFAMAQKATPGLQFNEDTFSGFLGEITNGQMSDSERRLIFATIANAAQGGTGRRIGQAIGTSQQLALEARPSVFTMASDLAGNVAANMFNTQSFAGAATDLGNWFDRTIAGAQRMGRRGDFVAGILASVGGTAFGGAGRMFGVDDRQLGMAIFDPARLREGAGMLVGTGGIMTDDARLARAAGAALEVDYSRIYAVEAGLAKVGIVPLQEGSDEARVKKANEEYTMLEARAKSGNTKAQGVLDSVSRSEYLATIAGAAGYGGRGVRDVLQQVRSGGGDSIGDIEAAKKMFTIAKEDLFRKHNVNVVGGVGYWSEANLRYGPQAVGDDSQEMAIISELHAGTLKTGTYERARAAGLTKDAADLYARNMVEIAKGLDVATPKAQTIMAVARLTGSQDAQDMVRMSLANAGLNVSGMDFSTQEGMARALKSAPDAVLQNLSRVAGSITAVTSDKRAQIIERQKQLYSNLDEATGAIQATLSQMGVVDLSMVTPEQMQSATNKLMVAELRSLTNVINRAKNVMRVEVVE